MDPSKRAEVQKEVVAFVTEYRAETQRAAVILIAAKMDSLLVQLVQKALLPCTVSQDDLLEGDGPLSTFSARIGLCHRLGLIDGEFTRALHLIRRIRNSFAHELVGATLDSGPHRDRITELASVLEEYESFQKLQHVISSGLTRPVGMFFAVAAIMIMRLHLAIASTGRLPATTVQLVPSNWEKK